MGSLTAFRLAHNINPSSLPRICGTDITSPPGSQQVFLPLSGQQGSGHGPLLVCEGGGDNASPHLPAQAPAWEAPGRPPDLPRGAPPSASVWETPARGATFTIWPPLGLAGLGADACGPLGAGRKFHHQVGGGVNYTLSPPTPYGHQPKGRRGLRGTWQEKKCFRCKKRLNSSQQ